MEAVEANGVAAGKDPGTLLIEIEG